MLLLGLGLCLLFSFVGCYLRCCTSYTCICRNLACCSNFLRGSLVFVNSCCVGCFSVSDCQSLLLKLSISSDWWELNWSTWRTDSSDNRCCSLFGSGSRSNNPLGRSCGNLLSFLGFGCSDCLSLEVIKASSIEVSSCLKCV